MVDSKPPRLDTPFARKGRGALSNHEGRFALQSVDRGLLAEMVGEGISKHADFLDDDVEQPFENLLKTQLIAEKAKTIITKNQSPDVPFEQSINPYQGCEHGCIYCFARPTHSYWDLSPGLDFETKIFYKENARELLTKALGKRNYQCKPIALGANTDPYQPVEKQLNITQDILEVLHQYRHPVTIVTKGSLITRDLDILSDMASNNLVSVAISLTTLDVSLKNIMEPRACAPKRRLAAIKELTAAGVPVSVLASPMIPFINDSELEAILAAAREAGAHSASYIFLRLPHEIKDLFVEWLQDHFPDRAARVLNTIKAARKGKLYQSEFGQRMRGDGVFADLLAKRFQVAISRLGYQQRNSFQLATEHFVAPGRCGDSSAGQLTLF